MKENKYTKAARKDYNVIARNYHKARTTRDWFYNELLEMPTTLKLLGDIKRKRILDLGCGSGIYAKILSKKGAKVKGIDISKEMIKIAREENPTIEFKVGNAEKLPYKNNEFDIVLSALMMEYLPKWDNTLREVRRILKPKGIFVFSTGNPVINAVEKIKFHGREFRIVKNYFKEGLRIDKWKFNKIKVNMKWHHKTYGTIIKSLIRNKFELIDYEDAYPVKRAKKLFPKHYRLWTNMPYFCTWKVRKK